MKLRLYGMWYLNELRLGNMPILFSHKNTKKSIKLVVLANLNIPIQELLENGKI